MEKGTKCFSKCENQTEQIFVFTHKHHASSAYKIHALDNVFHMSSISFNSLTLGETCITFSYSFLVPDSCLVDSFSRTLFKTAHRETTLLFHASSCSSGILAQSRRIDMADLRVCKNRCKTEVALV